MKKVLVTGATGYIGRRVVALLGRMDDVKVLTLSRNTEKAYELMTYGNVEHIGAEEWGRVKEYKPDVVLHLATYSTSGDNEEIIEKLIISNIMYGTRLLNALQECRNMLFVNIGSFAEYRLGQENGFRDAYLYTATKSAFRHIVDYYADKCGFRYVTAVPYTVYGGVDTGKKLIDYMVDSIDSEEPVKMTKGEQVLDFVHVEDVARFFAAMVEHSEVIENRHEFHLGTCVGTRVRDLAEIISREIGQKLNIEWGGREYRPLDVMYAVAPRDEYLNRYWKAEISIEEGVNEKLTCR
ncbi:MAG: NAD-dependent epimerase/dehydratase [Paludibacteraceae bacterium]|nr:NAD-dependent epimerase/dehydratase [Paludibacteraceae bacterium]